MSVSPIIGQRLSSISPSGNLLVTRDASDRGSFNLLDLNTYNLLLRIYTGYTEGTDPAISPDGKLLASGSTNTIDIWDLTTGQQLAKLEGFGLLDVVAFSTDSQILAAGGCREYVSAISSPCTHGEVKLIEVGLSSLIEKACIIAGRNLSKKEWNQYFPSEPYRITCSQYAAGQ